LISKEFTGIPLREDFAHFVKGEVSAPVVLEKVLYTN
jgi:hypothetical protein